MTSKTVVDRDVPVTTRDGVQLATDVYRPSGDEARPVLVIRTPYDKSHASFATLVLNPLVAVDRGYTVVVQDTRGCGQSEGLFEPFVKEAADGYDTVEWAAAQPWSTGRVGIYGSSYMGVTALQATLAAPPSLRAALVYLAPANVADGWVYTGGAFELAFNARWSFALAVEAARRRGADTGRTLAVKDAYRAFCDDPAGYVRRLPLRDMLGAAGEVLPHWQQWLDHTPSSGHWSSLDGVRHVQRIMVPVLSIAGWFDGFLRSGLSLAQALQRNPGAGHRLIIGPWDHQSYLTPRRSFAGERDFGSSAGSGVATMSEVALDWFDTHVAQRPTTALRPAVRYFLMGPNQWREAQSWPPPASALHMYLHSGGSANTAAGDGRLALQAPNTEQPPDSFVYDPHDPVPTLGGRHLGYNLAPSGVQDQQAIEGRSDVLVYTSEPLIEPLTVCGPVTADLYVRSSAPATDIVTKVTEVDAQGRSLLVCDGICRTDNLHDPITIDMGQTAYVFPTGSRIRLLVTSSDFPRFDRHLNVPDTTDATEARAATQVVLHNQVYPSRLTVHVMRNGAHETTP